MATTQEKYPPHRVFSSERTALKIGGTALLALTFQSLGTPGSRRALYA